MVVFGRLVLFHPCPVCFGRVPGRNKTAGVQADGSISVYKSRGVFVQSYLPPRKGSLLIQWEPNRLHLFCLSLKHSFLVLTGNNLAGISNWNELFNFYIDDLSCSQGRDLPCILQIGQAKSRCFYEVLFRPNLFIFLKYQSFTHTRISMQCYGEYLVTAPAAKIWIPFNLKRLRKIVQMHLHIKCNTV